jgi:hypothetical protein
MPIVGHLAENSFVVGDESREGTVAPATRNLAFIKNCIRQMPKEKRISALRSDSAAYQAEIINCCERKRIQFVIGAEDRFSYGADALRATSRQCHVLQDWSLCL